MRELIYPEGSWVAIVTPFAADGAVDLGVMRSLVDFHVANGSSALLILGSTGEPTTMTMEEKKTVIKAMSVYCKGKIRAFFGVTHGSTDMTIELARHAQENDADGIVIVVPPYLCPDQPSVLQYLIDVCLSVDIGVGLYNNPARVVANINPETIITLFNEVPNLVADKEAMPSVGQLAAVCEGTNGELPVFCCDSPAYALVIPTLGLGGSGTANVSGNVHPRAMAEMSRPWKSWEDVQRTRRLHNELLPVMEACYSATNPVAVKFFIRLLGFPVGPCRKPLREVSPEVREAMLLLIEEFELRKVYDLGQL
ncbi:MAG: dihydrodipicolinate synthase family protein [Deltaproteobacteria bacterium]|jgi:4-hydroxy-tetrahydrodipicolinate synthase|nr:dihydrodipicolinate synthase family protein [Deltaproteobacteria bacterium]